MRRTTLSTACRRFFLLGLTFASGAAMAQNTEAQGTATQTNPAPQTTQTPSDQTPITETQAANTTSSSTMSPALDRVSLWLGGYYADTSTSIGAGLNQYDVHGNLNLQHDLGFPQHQFEPRLRFDFLLGSSQGFSFDYYRIDQSRTKTLGASTEFDGNTYNANASVTGRLNFDFGSAAYKWWFGHSSDVFGIGLGAAYYHVFAGIKGQGSVDGNFVGETSASDSVSAWAPELQLGWRHAFTDNLRMYFNASGLKKNGDIGGHIYDGALGLEWFPWKNVGFGAEYDYTRIRVNDRHEYYHDDVALDLNGPSVYLRLRF